MNALKSALMIMGVLILAGFAFLSFVLYGRVTGTGYFAKNHIETTPVDFAALGLPTPIPGQALTMALHLGNDARVEAIHDVNNRILLLIRQPKVGDRLYLIEPRTGTVLSAISIGDAPPPVPSLLTSMPGTVTPAPAASAPVPTASAPTPAASTPKAPAPKPAPNGAPAR